MPSKRQHYHTTTTLPVLSLAGPLLLHLSGHFTSPLVISPHPIVSCARVWSGSLDVDPPTWSFHLAFPGPPTPPHPSLLPPLLTSCGCLAPRSSHPPTLISPRRSPNHDDKDNCDDKDNKDCDHDEDEVDNHDHNISVSLSLSSSLSL
jgi:hypothetical protein